MATSTYAVRIVVTPNGTFKHVIGAYILKLICIIATDAERVGSSRWAKLCNTLRTILVYPLVVVLRLTWRTLKLKYYLAPPLDANLLLVVVI